MHNAEAVEVLDTQSNLICQVPDTLLWQREASSLDVVEQVLALHVVEYDEVSLAVLEEIEQLDDVAVLAHLQDFNLSALLKDFDWLHVRLLDRLDGSQGSRDLVSRQFDHAELSLAQSLSKFVKVEQVGEAHGL